MGERRRVTDARIDPGADITVTNAGSSASLASDIVRLGRTDPDAGIQISVAVTVVAGLLLLDPDPTVTINGVPLLVSLAGICVALLLRRRAPSAAWLAAIAASVVAASLPIAEARSANPSVIGVDAWVPIALQASFGAIATLWIAMRYATRPTRRLDPLAVPLAVGLLGWLILACVTTIALVVSGQRRPDPAFTWVDAATVPIAVYFVFVVVVTGLGVVADIEAAVDRASRRTGTSIRRDWSPARAVTLAAATLHELIPGQVDAEAAAIEAERIRLAGDLHASVLPSLRRAIAEAEAGFPIENLAARLRAVDHELERLMADRWPVVLEAFGLIEALEDLAEQTEADTAAQVVLEIDGSLGRPQPEIERAAWRIAQLALDNALRHAAASRITIRVAVAPDRLSLVIADDGRGFDSTDAVRAGARGLADLDRRASAVGGTVAIEPGPVSGMVVRFDWPGSG
jgi:signal transduction histidine kinase